MRRIISPALFAAVFPVVYTALAIVDWTPFLYYPQINRLSTVALDRKAGPSMHWYGWIAAAVVIALVICVIVPRRWTAPVERYLAWIPAIAAVLAILIFEKRWFL